MNFLWRAAEDLIKMIMVVCVEIRDRTLRKGDKDRSLRNFILIICPPPHHLLPDATSLSLVTHKRLKEIASAQQVEIQTLAGELDKMRMRTYPTFVHPSPAHLPPDTKASLWK